ncbi:hypothetical protein K466DRAFT_650454 [Polyporus arcularius HHB13444]|uniref:Uncharacterized protein n=1 Tax=Polyporus arcularius HHB13444 TaxID=1314778 RepID=A0A5C3PT76_9APHY|nr:hypothetical protein K466DRAFT_650454 [Polyporus arcularius HHB13444]
MSDDNFLTIDNAESVIVAPLYMMCAAYSSLAVQFTGTGYINETREIRNICCFQPDPDHGLDVRPTQVMMFETVCFISPFEYFGTARGHEDFDGITEEPLVSFWLTERRRGDHLSRIYWEQVVPAVQAIAESIPGEVDLSEVVCTSPEDGSVRLQVKWQPVQGKTIESALPFYSKLGRRFVPESILDVPFGQAVRVAFTFEYHYKYVGRRPEDKPRTLHAFLSHVSVL